MQNNPSPLVTVIMPHYKQENFIGRAISSLLNQDHLHWELIIVQDGPGRKIFSNTPADSRISYLINERNEGLGFTINRALDYAQGEFICYLPADDLYYRNHLSTLLQCLQRAPASMMAYSSMKHHYNRIATTKYGHCFQLVQVMHRKTSLRWMERSTLESDDLDRLFFNAVDSNPVHTGKLTCEWVDHPMQRHKIMQEPIGGINYFRQYYAIKTPLRFHSSKGHQTDEEQRYEPYRKKTYPSPSHGLKILIVGELAYNPERILALAEKGHKLFGLWMKKPYWYNYVGPLPFGHVTDLNPLNWKEEIRKIAPDIIYGCLNWQAVPFIHEVVTACPDIPFCWHFKEGPFICLEKGYWNELISLYQQATGRIYCSDEMGSWFNGFLEPASLPDLVLDGDLPKKDWFRQERVPLLSQKDGAFHTVVPGRPIGLHPHNVEELARQNIHLHFYGEFTHGQWLQWIEKTLTLAPDHLHIHPNIAQENWVEEFSCYDAGWLHFFQSDNHGEIARANWDDLNIPARMATLAAAGLPMIQANNHGHIVATQSLAIKYGLGIFPRDMKELGSMLADKDMMQQIRNNVWSKRELFFFDEHADELIRYFRQVIDQHRQAGPTKSKSPAGKLPL